MVIHKVKARVSKGGQQYEMVYDCTNHWHRVNFNYFQSHQEIMNMKTYRYNLKHGCYVALTYHFNPNKW